MSKFNFNRNPILHNAPYAPRQTTLLQKCSRPIKLTEIENGKFVQAKDQCGIKAANSFFTAKVRKRRFLRHPKHPNN